MVGCEQKVRSTDVSVIDIEDIVDCVNCKDDLVDIPNYLSKYLLFSSSVREGLASSLSSRV